MTQNMSEEGFNKKFIEFVYETAKEMGLIKTYLNGKIIIPKPNTEALQEKLKKAQEELVAFNSMEEKDLSAYAEKDANDRYNRLLKFYNKNKSADENCQKMIFVIKNLTIPSTKEFDDLKEVMLNKLKSTSRVFEPKKPKKVNLNDFIAYREKTLKQRVEACKKAIEEDKDRVEQGKKFISDFTNILGIKTEDE
jgi:hypothetical protein